MILDLAHQFVTGSGRGPDGRVESFTGREQRGRRRLAVADDDERERLGSDVFTQLLGLVLRQGAQIVNLFLSQYGDAMVAQGVEVSHHGPINRLVAVAQWTVLAPKVAISA